MRWPCPATRGYTLIEKLQTISTKFRKQQETGEFPANFLRRYYHVFCLLDQPDVRAFIGTEACIVHKQKRFPKADNQNINSNPAFSLSDPETFRLYERAYEGTSALYYHGRPSLKQILARITSYADRGSAWYLFLPGYRNRHLPNPSCLQFFLKASPGPQGGQSGPDRQRAGQSLARTTGRIA
ncbi:hypothetical protein AGR6A_pAt50037 [Agrobacterium sp. NCPPB 925]|nr:hypothetical protein AGR6A_pAt50037 [Agrobacterium sp. NCPPB 925]